MSLESGGAAAGAPAPRELVLASAGSGKTYHISSRIIGLLAHGEEPEHLLASTFTRKAAGQILDRVLSRLAAAALDAEEAATLARAATLHPAFALPDDRDFWAALLARVARGLHRFNVGTLDAFFMRAASAFESELGLPPSWRVPADPALGALRSRALLVVLERVERPRMIELLRLLARGDARRSVHDHLFTTIDRLLAIEEQLDPAVPDPWSAFAAPREMPVPGETDRIRLAQAIEALPLPKTKSGTDRRHWARAVSDAAAALRTAEWERLASLTLSRRVASDEPIFDGVLISSEVRELFEKALEQARVVLRPRLAAQVRALAAVTRAYRDAFRALQHQAGLYGFADVTRLIGGGDPLGDRADLYYRLDARTRHVLLDEFQDTSLPQWEALAPLVDEILSDEGRAAVIVADPKQSIYGWRGAEPRIVHRVGERYSLASEHLATSWRSSDTVLDLVNRVFERIGDGPLWGQDEVCARVAAAWVDDFRRHRAQRDLPGYAVVEVGPSDEGRGGQRPLLCRHTAKRVASILRDCPGYSIGVLTRTNPMVARLFVELRDLGVAVSQEGGNPLTDSAACEALLALFRLADHPADTIARYHVASSPLGDALGFTDHRDEAAARRLARDLRRRLTEEGYGPTITSLSRRIAPACDRREARRLAQLGELAHRYDASATLRPMDFVRLAETERAEDRASADVRVMTVHQAKGLEFDVVVLPDLDDPIFKGGRPAPVLPWRTDPAGRITAVYPYGSEALRCLFPELQAAYEQGREGIFRDGLSALYVALTRARYALHAIISADSDSGPGTAMTPARILREALRAPGEPLLSAADGTKLFETGTARWHLDPRAVAERDRAWGEPPPPMPIRLHVGERGRLLRRATPSRLSLDSDVDVAELLRLGRSAARERGLVAHAWLERIEWLEDGTPGDVELLRIARREAPGLDEERLRQLVREFHGWVATPALRALLSRSSYPVGTTAEREVPFLHRVDDALMEGVIDRLLLVGDATGVLRAEILDFKTDPILEDLAGLSERYRPQIAAYAAAVADMFGLPAASVSMRLVFLETGSVRVVDLAVEPPPESPAREAFPPPRSRTARTAALQEPTE